MSSSAITPLDYGWLKRLFRQIEDLHDPAEWDERDRPLQAESFATFLRLIAHIRPDKEPGLGLTHSGELIAAWADGRNRLTIECLPNDLVRWTMVRWIDDVRESAAGSTSLQQLLSALAPYGPERWFGG